MAACATPSRHELLLDPAGVDRAGDHVGVREQVEREAGGRLDALDPQVARARGACARAPPRGRRRETITFASSES